jgi:hypothetical protein
MGRMGQILVAGSTVLLLALSAVTVLAAPITPGAPGGPTERSSTLVSASPAVFAERVTAAQQSAGDRSLASLQTTFELIVLAGVCAVGVALYSAASAAPSDSARMPVRIRRH